MKCRIYELHGSDNILSKADFIKRELAAIRERMYYSAEQHLQPALLLRNSCFIDSNSFLLQNNLYIIDFIL